MLKEIIISVESYFKAHQLIQRHNLWKWIIIPGIVYALLFVLGIWFFWTSSSAFIDWLSNLIGVRQWLENINTPILNFLFIFTNLILRIIFLFFYFSLFKYFFLIVGSPVFAYLSERTESILNGKEFPFSFNQLIEDIRRGISLALRNALWQTVYIISIMLLSLIPVVGWIAPLVAFMVECYYYGFSMLDYNFERQKLPPAESISFIRNHKGLAIGNGIMFYLFHIVPVIGWVLAPAYAVIAATLSLYPATRDLPD